MKNIFILISVITTLAIIFSSCESADRSIETPSGRVESVNGDLSILRIVRKTTTTGNMRDARGGVVNEDITFDCPEGTVAAIPVLEQLAYGYGEFSPGDLSAVDSLGTLSFSWSSTKQRPLGMHLFGVRVTDIDAPRPGGEQTVSLKTSAYLSDENFDDEWWSIGTYHVLCIGRTP